jgi:hypothetical protein
MHEGEFVTTGANKSLSDLVRSTFSGIPCSPISTLSNSIGVLRFFQRVLSMSGSKDNNSKFKDRRLSIQHTRNTKID